MFSLDLVSSHPLSHPTEDERGAVYTRREVVDTILDLAGYTKEQPLRTQCILEPASGKGDFLYPTVERLLDSFFSHGGAPASAVDLQNCILAVEVSPASHARTKQGIREYLETRGISSAIAEGLVGRWFLNADFLLAPLPVRFHYVVGNPPYIRQERIPAALLTEYRKRFRTRG